MLYIWFLYSLGIDDPITKTAAGSEREYYKELAKEMFLILDQPIKVRREEGGNITRSWPRRCSSSWTSPFR